MDKYVKVFCQQNPTYYTACSHCGKTNALKSMDVLSHRIYKFRCRYCGEYSTMNASKSIKDLPRQLKSMGLDVK